MNRKELARKKLKEDPDYFKNLGSKGGKKRAELYPELNTFTDKEYATKMSKLGVKARRNNGKSG